MTCPECNGNGTTVASHVSYADGTGAYNVNLKCTRCHGTCEVDDRTPEWNPKHTAWVVTEKAGAA
jgi:DnaJ-class molecular chaperone